LRAGNHIEPCRRLDQSTHRGPYGRTVDPAQPGTCRNLRAVLTDLDRLPTQAPPSPTNGADVAARVQATAHPTATSSPPPTTPASSTSAAAYGITCCCSKDRHPTRAPPRAGAPSSACLAGTRWTSASTTYLPRKQLCTPATAYARR